jgi:hypothetical protein
MPLSSITIPANGSERQQVMPLIDRILVKNNQPGRPRKRVKVLAADKGYDSKELRKAIVNVVLDHSCQNELGKQRKIGVDQLRYQSLVFKSSVVSHGFNGNTVGSLFDGRESLPVSMLLFLLPQFTFGLTEFC